jgi:hypothetical protein
MLELGQTFAWVGEARVGRSYVFAPEFCIDAQVF